MPSLQPTQSIPGAVAVSYGLPRHLRISKDGTRAAIPTPYGVAIRTLPTSAAMAANSGSSIDIYSGSKHPVTVCGITPDGKRVVGGDDMGNIHVWTADKKVYKVSNLRV